MLKQPTHTKATVLVFTERGLCNFAFACACMCVIGPDTESLGIVTEVGEGGVHPRYYTLS